MSTDKRIVYLNPRDLQPSRQNVRSDPGDLAGLAETIREHGILQPLGVVHEGDGHRIVYGNRRRDAAIVVGLDRVPCMVLDDVAAEDTVVQQVLENLQRLDLNDLDKSRAFERLVERTTEDGSTLGEALDAMARTLGLSARQIQRYLRLRQLHPDVQRLIAQEEIGVTHGQHLVDVTPASRQVALAELVVEESLSAAELSRVCAALERNANIGPRAALDALRKGERVAVIEAHVTQSAPRLGPAPAPREKSDDGLWDDEPDAQSDPAGPGAAGRHPGSGPGFPEPTTGYRDDRSQSNYGESSEYGGYEPATRDGNRVRRIHSLDSFMDELQRLTQCVQEGDLQRLLRDDEAGKMKISLAARQLRFLADAVSALAKASNASN